MTFGELFTHSFGQFHLDSVVDGIIMSLSNIMPVMHDRVRVMSSCHHLFFWFISSALLEYFFLCTCSSLGPHPVLPSRCVSVCPVQPCYQKARQWLLANIPSVLVFGVCIGVVQVFI